MPTSEVLALEDITRETNFLVEWQADDATSGTYYYDVYARENEGEYRLWKFHTYQQEAIFTANDSTLYEFYVIAYDKVDNKENKAATAEASTYVNVNYPPSDILLSNNYILENNEIGKEIGTLQTQDLNTDNTFTYQLVDGEGSSGNTAFEIDGNSLKAKIIFDYETQNEYSLRVKTTDTYGSTFEKVLSVTILDDNETSINNLTEKPLLKISPNPAKNETFVIIKTAYKNSEISIIDITGKTIYAKNSEIKPYEKIDLTNFQNGFYIISCKIDGRLYNLKLIKQ